MTRRKFKDLVCDDGKDSRHLLAKLKQPATLAALRGQHFKRGFEQGGKPDVVRDEPDDNNRSSLMSDDSDIASDPDKDESSKQAENSSSSGLGAPSRPLENADDFARPRCSKQKAGTTAGYSTVRVTSNDVV